MHPKLAPTEAGRGHNEHMGGFNNCCIMRVFRISAERREIVSVLRLPSRANNSTKKAKMAHRFLAEHQVIPH